MCCRADLFRPSASFVCALLLASFGCFSSRKTVPVDDATRTDIQERIRRADKFTVHDNRFEHKVEYTVERPSKAFDRITELVFDATKSERIQRPPEFWRIRIVFATKDGEVTIDAKACNDPFFAIDGRSYGNWHVDIEGKISQILSEFVHFYDSGARKATGNYASGKHGIWTYYYENGNKMCEGDYEHGKKIGKWDYWTPEGEHSTKLEN